MLPRINWKKTPLFLVQLKTGLWSHMQLQRDSITTFAETMKLCAGCMPSNQLQTVEEAG